MKAIVKLLSRVILVGLFLALLLAPIAQWFETGINLGAMLESPSAAHPLGTDNLGRDLLFRIQQCMFDAVLPVWTVALLASMAGFVFGAFLCLCSDTTRHGLIAPLSVGVGIPIGILVFYMAVLTQVITLAALLVPLGLLVFLRSVYFVLNTYENDRLLGYWLANITVGGSRWYRVLHYGLVKAWRNQLLQTLSFNLKIALICEVGLSYLGFGVQEPGASFGNILASHFTSYLNGHFSVLTVVTLALWLCTLVPDCVIALLTYKPPSTCRTSPVM